MQLVGLSTITLECSFMIICILFVRNFLAGRFRPWVMKCLWSLLTVRILIPIRFQIEAEWLQSIKDITYLKQITEWLCQPELVIAVSVVWLCGVIFFIFYFLVKNSCFVRRLKKHREIYGRKENLLVYFVDGRIGSCLEGLFAPKIYISRLAEPSVDWCKWIVNHELCHYHFRDNWHVFLRNLCLVLQWFNVLLWYAVGYWVEDCELACDYAVTKDKTREEQIAYGKCLVAMSARRPEKYMQNLTTGNSLSEVSIRKRVEMISLQEYGPFWQELLVAGLMLGMLLLTFLTPNASNNTWVYAVDAIPVVTDYVVRYELEEPTEENRQQVLANMKIRKGWSSRKHIQLVPVGEKEVAIIFPLTEERFFLRMETFADNFVLDTDYTVLIDNKEEYRIDLEPEDLVEKKRGEEYSFWVAYETLGFEKPSGSDYKVYGGSLQEYEGSEMDMTEDFICIYRTTYEASKKEFLERLLTNNPCELIRR